ncbi:MAG: hypothetical protein O9972_41330 [Burkholderiales bacterium]|nr:hypothetical protein [Burkholderiales bacterium]
MSPSPTAASRIVRIGPERAERPTLAAVGVPSSTLAPVGPPPGFA